MMIGHMGQQEAWITLHMFRAAFGFLFVCLFVLFCFLFFKSFNGIAAVTKPLGFGETDFHKAILSECLDYWKECGIHMPKSRGWQHMISRWSVSTAAPPKGIHVATTPPCHIFISSKDSPRKP